MVAALASEISWPYAESKYFKRVTHRECPTVAAPHDRCGPTMPEDQLEPEAEFKKSVAY